jgi:hypothetical protein
MIEIGPGARQLAKRAIVRNTGNGQNNPQNVGNSSCGISQPPKLNYERNSSPLAPYDLILDKTG